MGQKKPFTNENIFCNWQTLALRKTREVLKEMFLAHVLAAAGWMRLGRKKGQHVKLIIFENNILLIRDKQKNVSRNITVTIEEGLPFTWSGMLIAPLEVKFFHQLGSIFVIFLICLIFLLYFPTHIPRHSSQPEFVNMPFLISAFDSPHWLPT